MAIEVDYFAWEKWQQTEHDFDGDYSRKWAHKLPYFFALKGTQWRVKTAVLVASILYRRDDMPIAAVFEFFAEDEAAPISKILRMAFTIRERNKIHIGSDVYYDELSLDTETAARLDKLFASLPEPREGGMDISSIRSFDFYKVQLGLRYGVKAYDWSDGHQAFSLPENSYQSFFTTIDEILTICENLMPHRYPKAKTIRQALEIYEKEFQLKAKYMKHRGRWPHPKSSRYHGYDMEDLESFKTKDMQESGNLIDFKYYLPRFLKFMAFDRPYIQEFTYVHETILFSKLLEADLLSWDEDEKKTLNDYFLALFKYKLSYYPSITLSASSLLLWLIKLEIDLQPFLDYWESTIKHIDSLRHLGAFLEKIIGENMVDNLPCALADWLRQAKVEKAVINARNAYQGKRPYAHEFFEALENLQLIHA